MLRKFSPAVRYVKVLSVGHIATVIDVMIASPSDVPKERLIIRDVIAEWNAIHAKDRKTVLMAIGWETHSSPDMGDRPQAIINGQLLKDADLLVAVFWTRIGSPTGVARSGTVEEIEEHIMAGKPAMIYFSLAPVRLDSVDDNQYAAVKAFRESLRPKGLVEEYEYLSQFRMKFVRQLAQIVIRRFTSSSAPTAHAAIPVPVLPAPKPIPELGSSARELLIEASQDSNGVIMSLETMEGSHVQTNERNFASGEARSAAQWKSAVTELNRLGLTEDRGGKGEVFFVTDEGYRVADLLKQQ